MKKKLIPCIYLKDGKAVRSFSDAAPVGDALALAAAYSEAGADELMVLDLSNTDKTHEEAIGLIRSLCAASQVPVIGGGNIRRLEDVKKLIYAGCARVMLNFSKEGNIDLVSEASRRFGREKMLASVATAETCRENQVAIQEFVTGMVALGGSEAEVAAASELPVIVLTDVTEKEALLSLLKEEKICGLSGSFVNGCESLSAFKEECRAAGLSMEVYESTVPWDQLKKNENGLVPVIVQDYRTDEVLMLAYMNEEAFEKTLRSGRMTYYSRSRQELWVKGLTSGHYQYVKSLALDCDNDTILAKVDQIGAACHTGSRSCFFQTLMKKEYDDTNPLRVFQDVYDVIQDRKIHPKEGSYTNYLFDKGIDKILKKVGEECTEIVIAAKNPDKEEIKYEISDFLYHAMVLMVEKGVSWEDITRELARR